MTSFQDLLGSAPEHTLEDVVAQNNEVEDKPEQEIARRVLSMLEGMDEKYRIPMKLYLIFHDNLLS